MKKLALLVAVLALAVGGGVIVYAHASSNNEQRECSTTIICPITGEEICECCCPLAR